MTRQRYNKTESLNRILRSLKGSAVPQDTPESVSGEILSVEEALSDLAELLAGSLPNESFTSPSTMKASISEANAGTSDNVFLTPLSHSWAHEYGGIYTATGSVLLTVPANVWTKVTGTFHADMYDSGEVNPEYSDDKLIINEAGAYFVVHQISVLNLGDATTFETQAYYNGTALPSTRSYAQLDASGTAGASKVLYGAGMNYLGTVAKDVDVRIRVVGETIYQPMTAQLSAQKMVG